MKRYFLEMHGWMRKETVRGKVSVNECSRCGKKPVIHENHLGLFKISCPRCWWNHPEESIDVASMNIYKAIKEWNRINQKKEDS